MFRCNIVQTRTTAMEITPDSGPTARDEAEIPGPTDGLPAVNGFGGPTTLALPTLDSSTSSMLRERPVIVIKEGDETLPG